jgi:hypothetical protein
VKTLKLLLASLLVMALVFPTVALAKDTAKAGKITSVSGPAEVKKSGGSKKFKAFKGMAITQGDSIITGASGKIVMDLDSDKEVTIGSDTTLVVSELVKNAKALNGKTSLSLLKGKVVIKIKKKLEGDSRFEIETPTAIMGVMGTEFVVQYEDQQSYVAVFEGRVQTSFGGQQRFVDPDRQLLVDKERQGEVEPLDYRDLSLIGLEFYQEKLEQNPNTNQALLNAVKQLVVKKKAEAEAAAAAGNGAGTPTNSTIVYEDTTTNTSAPASTPTVPTPTIPSTGPTPTPSTPAGEPTPTPSTEPTEGPTTTPSTEPSEEPTATPVPVPPVLETDEFYENIDDYLISDQIFILPFSTELAWNDVNVTLPADAAAAVEVEVYNVQGKAFQKIDVVDEVSINPNNPSQLRVKLSEGILYGAKISFTVLANSLMNSETNDIQTESQVTVNSAEEKGFLFMLDTTAKSVSFKQYGEESNKEVSFGNLGYEVAIESVQKVCQGFPGFNGIQEYGYEERYCNPEEEFPTELEELFELTSNNRSSVVEFKAEYFNSEERDAATYKFEFSFQKDGNTVDTQVVNVIVVPPNPPYLEYDGSRMLTLDSFVLQFSAPIELAPESGTAIESLGLQKCPPLSEGCIAFPYPFPFQGEGEGNNGGASELEIKSAIVDPEDPTRLIVTLKEELEYWDSFSVTVYEGQWSNSETGDIQYYEQNVEIDVRADFDKNDVEFQQGLTGSEYDVEVKLNTLGNPVVVAQLQCFSCGEFTPPTDLNEAFEITGAGDIKVIKLKASYFAAFTEGFKYYNVILRIYRNEEEVNGNATDLIWLNVNNGILPV